MATLEECLFRKVGSCSQPDQGLIRSSSERLSSIADASYIRKDGLHEQLNTSSIPLFFHKNCVSTYTSKTHLKRLHKSASAISLETQQPAIKRHCRSGRTFDFLRDCLFCGHDCELVKCSKNPNRWKRSFLCRTAEDGQKSFKNVILGTCDIRQDAWGDEVRLRVEGAVSDLHAAEARYHDKCRANFMAPKSVALTAYSLMKIEDSGDKPFVQLVKTINEDQSQIRNSSDIYCQYLAYGGIRLTKRQLTEEVSSFFSPELIVLRGRGISSILVFREAAKDTFKMVMDENEGDDLSSAMKKISKQVKQEIKEISQSRDEYRTRINRQVMEEYTSQTMVDFLKTMLPGDDHTLPIQMICNMITGLLKKHPTPLQTALGVFIKEKSLIQELYRLGAVCSYDEVLRFRKSAALASTDVTSKGLQHVAQTGSKLVQVVVDNFDANISSQNGLQSTHSLAMLLIQPASAENQQTNDDESITRIKKEEMTQPLVDDITIERYTGPKKPYMPEGRVTKSILPLKILAMQAITSCRASERDFDFLSTIIEGDSTPEWNGFNTALNRQEGHTVILKTTSVYTPLIDMKPADPDTMLTAMVQAERLTKQAGQDIVVFTCDQQLYRVAVHITWVYPERFNNFFLRLGGMHFIMNFIGCIGSLMSETGLEEILESSFGSVTNMLSGKKFPQNFRALRIVSEELLRNIMPTVYNPQDLMTVLESKASKSRTTRLWLDMLIKPVLLMAQFVRAEKEADWPLHLLTVRLMMPYFFAAGHHNYSRYGLYYLRTAESLRPELLEKFLKGEHVPHLSPGLWNGIWTDMMIETTFMKYGKGPDGIIGITLKPNALKTWALSFHACSVLANEIADLTAPGKTECRGVHKEEMKGRIEADAQDRRNIRQKLEETTDPLDELKLPADKLLNVVNGRYADDTVNADQALDLGKREMAQYEGSWPDGFHKPLSKKIITMAVMKNHLRIGQRKLFDTNLIFSRIIGLQASGREINMEDILKFELSPVPTSLFTDAGDMRTAQNKSVLKRQLQVNQTEEDKRGNTLFESATRILDGCALLWTIHWPRDGKVKDFVDNFTNYVLNFLQGADILDRYNEYSIKSATRSARQQVASRQYQLSLHMPLPPQKVLLTVASNKVQLIDLIVHSITDLKENIELYDHRIVITASEHVPMEIHRGLIINREDLATTHEEADVIMVQQMDSVAEARPDSIITVICDDTDVFILLLHFYQKKQLTCKLFMEGTSNNTCIDIRETVKKHSTIVSQLVAIHAFSGCDTVAQSWGVGKTTVLKLLKAGRTLNYLGHPDAPLDNLFMECFNFISACYKQPSATSMSELRLKVWRTKVGRRTLMSKIMALPPTQEAFKQNVLRAHLQACLWMNALDPDPPQMDPAEYGWRKDELNKTLTPVMLPEGTASAPDYILKLLKCSCDRCNSSRCSCAVARLPCTIFCECEGSDCLNQHTLMAKHDVNETD